jgi:hypothetical protein
MFMKKSLEMLEDKPQRRFLFRSKFNRPTSPNKAYQAPVLRASAQILLRRTSDILETLSEMPKPVQMQITIGSDEYGI